MVQGEPGREGDEEEVRYRLGSSWKSPTFECGQRQKQPTGTIFIIVGAGEFPSFEVIRYR